jgi:hypothetical protein
MTTGWGKGSAAGAGSGSGTGAETGSGAGTGSGSNTATGGEGVVGLATGMDAGSGAGLGETSGTCEAQDVSITKPASTAHLQSAAPRSGFIKASRSSVRAFSKPGFRSRVNRCCVHARDSILLA